MKTRRTPERSQGHAPLFLPIIAALPGIIIVLVSEVYRRRPDDA